MSALLDRIRGTQILAGERAVLQDLHDKGLCLKGCEICKEEQMAISETLAVKLAGCVNYMEELRSGRVGRQDTKMARFLDDPEVAEWLTRMKKSGRINIDFFTNLPPK